MKLPTAWCCAVLLASFAGPALAQEQTPPPQGVSRGENFSAKPPAQLFASDCTGSGCHKGPQGLAKGQMPGTLTGFLREHYTNSRESAAARANYLAKIPSGPEPREARTPRGGKPAAAASPPGNSNWGPEGIIANEPRPPNEARGPRHPNSRASRAAARPDEEPAAAPTPPPVAAPPAAEPAASARAQRARPGATAAAPSPEPEAAAAPPTPPKPKQQYDIFD
jgi:hypothetical protein